MTQTVDQQDLTQSTAPACSTTPSGRRFLGAGLGSGLLGGICCIGGAIAIGASVGGLSFFSTWMERYQIYFVVVSLLVMALWLLRQVRRHAQGGGRSTVKAFLQHTWRQLAVMGAAYLVTLGVAMAVVAAVRM
ncbi:MAG TPA: hypothetical protein DGT23_06715 [Micromonosporaceae bacterium]|nr:hypothetical protein [Micromonosporaceae bacterium]